MLNRTNWRYGMSGFAFVAAGVALAAQDAGAAVTLLQRSSIIDADAFAQGGFGGSSTDSDSNGTANFGPFNDTVTAETGFEVSTSTAEAEAFQNSTVSFIGGSNFVGADAQGTADAFVLASQMDIADADGSSDFVIRFSIPAGESYNYTLSGNLGTEGTGASAQLYLDRVLPAFEEQFFRSGNAGPFNTSGTLGAGTYDLSAFAGALSTEQLQGTKTANFTVDFDLTPVPEPATLALVALPAALLARRRRRA